MILGNALLSFGMFAACVVFILNINYLTIMVLRDLLFGYYRREDAGWYIIVFILWFVSMGIMLGGSIQ